MHIDFRQKITRDLEREGVPLLKEKKKYVFIYFYIKGTMNISSPLLGCRWKKWGAVRNFPLPLTQAKKFNKHKQKVIINNQLHAFFAFGWRQRSKKRVEQRPRQ